MSEPTSRIDEIAVAFWEDSLPLQPTTATVYGDDRYDDRLEDPGPEGRAAARALAERVLREIAEVPDAGLSVEERITKDMLGIVAKLGIEGDDLAFHELRAIDHMEGIQLQISQISQFQAADTPERLEKFVARLHAYDDAIDATIGVLEDGRASGRTAARIVVERTIDQLDRLLAIPVDESPIVATARVSSEADRAAVRGALRESIYPANRRFRDALAGPYLAASRELPGLVSAPDGEALYRYAIRAWTTLDMDPRDVHQVGLDELATIDEERRAIANVEGYGDDVEAYRRALAEDPANQAATREELVARATEDIARALEVAPRIFGRLPASGCEVKPVEAYKEKDVAFAYYYPPTLDGSRPGTYYVNTYDLPSRTFSKLASTTYHEAIPGHHFQIALEMEHPSLNLFRRLGSRMVGGAYVEGWGLYAERLADEYGLYRNAGERLGMLDAQAWRASRLIVDSGMHGLGWTRQQSIDQLLRTGLSMTDAVIETDRYIGWPGQALCYMTGMRVIRQLRRDLEARDGAAFDLRSFHDEAIGHGSLPLATLAKELPGWVKPKT
ncbi:MAG TPA: DUF885 domain-containing protein [Candidatus Limnocylindrales bacterium]|nr:DUF885 domain-containing protein [Candidatus Limnocylindrales bacterium]